MPDPEVKIKFTSEYDDAAAKEALLDFENLPIQAGGLVEVINQNYAVLEQMAEALRQTTAGLREHVAALDPAAEGYDRAVANCRSYIAQQVVLSQQCEAVRNSIMEQAGTVLDLSKALENGSMSEAQFEDTSAGLTRATGEKGKTRPREQRYSKLKHPAKNKDTAKRERDAAKLAKTPPGKVMTRLLASVRNKSETKNFSPLPQPINPVNRRTQARIHDITGINTSGWMHTASEQSLHHIQTEHALEIMQTDFHLIQEIQSQWNSLVLSEKNKRRCLEYKKKYGRRVFTLIEEIRPKSKSFAIITFYANKRK